MRAGEDPPDQLPAQEGLGGKDQQDEEDQKQDTAHGQRLLIGLDQGETDNLLEMDPELLDVGAHGGRGSGSVDALPFGEVSCTGEVGSGTFRPGIARRGRRA